MKILVIRLSSMGDIIVTSPVVRWLKEQLNAEIHFLIKPQFVEIIQFNPFIDEIKIYDKTHVDWTHLKNENYTLIVDLHKSRASLKVSMMLGVKTIRYNKLNIQKWIYTNFKINLLPRIHLVDRYYHALEKIGIKNDGKGLDFYIDPKAILLSELPKYFEVIVLGAAHQTKRIPISLAQKIILKSEVPIILLGGKDVYLEGNLLASAELSTINLCGQTDLHTTAVIIKAAKKVHTGDTGLMHLAAALEKDITVYWGSTAPIIGMYPYISTNSKAIIEHKILNLWCQPCTKIGYKKCPLGHFRCMNDQTI
jgi:ADP-heptose:LPS heptosyltransferase